jgi:transcriptional regulator with XRE-family HTH domain
MYIIEISLQRKVVNKMGKDGKKVADNPISKNLDRLIRSGDGSPKNLKKIEDEIGIAGTTVRSWINGHRKPQQNSLEKIAKFFNVDVYPLYDEPGESAIGDQLPFPDQKEIIDMIIKINNHFSLELLKTIAKIEILRKNDNPNDKSIIN